jgi:hypothetical protein
MMYEYPKERTGRPARLLKAILRGSEGLFPDSIQLEATGPKVSFDLGSTVCQVTSDSFRLTYCNQGSPWRSTPDSWAGL